MLHRRELDLSYNAITSLAGVTFPSSLETVTSPRHIETARPLLVARVTFNTMLSRRKLDLQNNQITALAGVTFNFTDCE